MPARIMTDEEAKLADSIYQAIQDATNYSKRSQQSAEFVMGVSDIGTCPERTRRLLARIPMADSNDKLEAFMGTAIGEAVEQALAQAWPTAIFQRELSTTINVGGASFLITGHPDVVVPNLGVGDGKTVHGLAVTERTGPTDQQRFQRHIYTKMASEAGLLEVPLDEARTFNWWVDRAGADKYVYVEMDHYSDDVVRAAGLWLESAFYAYDHGIEAEKTPPRQWCKSACGHFRECRQFDSDVQGLITDPVIVEAARAHEEGTAMAKEGKRIKDAANAALKGIDGYTPNHQIRHVHVNAADDGSRKGYDRLEVTRIKR